MADEKNNIPKRGNAYKGFSSRADNSNFKLYDFVPTRLMYFI